MLIKRLNNKCLKWGMFLLLSVPNFAVQATGINEEQISNLKRSIKQVDEKIENDFRQLRNLQAINKGAVVTIGYTGHGKSTLINFLAKKTLNASKLHGEWKIDVLDGLPGITPGHLPSSQTSFPQYWYDREQQLIYYDCPGFGDNRGPEADIRNGYAFYKLFKNLRNTKIAIVVREPALQDRAGEFQKVVKNVADLFKQDIERLSPSCCLIVTKQDQFETSADIQGKLDSIAVDREINIDLKIRNLLTMLAQRSQIAFFPRPTGPSPKLNYLSSQTPQGSEVFNSITQAIGATAYINNIVPSLASSAESKNFAQHLAINISEETKKYISTTVADSLYTACEKKIEQGSFTTVAELRNMFGTLATALQNIRHTNSQDFEADLLHSLHDNNIELSYDFIKKQIGYLEFLKTVNSDINNPYDSWTASLTPVIQNIRSLGEIPIFVNQNNVITINGIILGLSDINQARNKNNFSSIKVYALNTLLIDEDFKSPQTSCSFIAPSWVVKGTRTVDLSGIDGKPGNHGIPIVNAVGGNGQPGEPGMAGGNFYGKLMTISYLVENVNTNNTSQAFLTVKSNGGNGGWGGNGAVGANGTSGNDGDLAKRKHVYNISLGGKQARAEVYSHDDKGTDALSGFNGGQGGIGGFEGHKGEIIIHGAQFNLTAKDGIVGKNGNPGIGGKGGLHGRNCQGKTWDSWWKPDKGTQTCEGRCITRSVNGTNFPTVEHVIRNPSHAVNGTSPIELNILKRQNPIVHTPLNYRSSLTEYQTYALSYKVKHPETARVIKALS